VGGGGGRVVPLARIARAARGGGCEALLGVKRVATWAQKRGLLAHLTSIAARLDAVDAKLVSREPIAPNDQALYDVASGAAEKVHTSKGI
jgi:hypothetical protein